MRILQKGGNAADAAVAMAAALNVTQPWYVRKKTEGGGGVKFTI